MGVPHFFRYVASQHRAVVRPHAPHAGIDVLLVDLNCAVHRCAEAVVASAQRDADAASLDIDDLVIAETLSWLRDLLSVARPRVEAFVALDGVPPLAKSVQQRARRFMASAAASSPGWTSSRVTPGTAFMGRLDAELAAAAADGRLRESLPPTCTVRVSTSAEPGEGEHKLLRRADALADVGAPAPMQMAVYGADADLILLSMLRDACCMHVVREDIERPATRTRSKQQDLVYVDVGALRRRIESRTGMPASEFVAATLLLGNDFVPTLTYLRAKERGIETLVATWSRLREEDSRFRLLETADERSETDPRSRTRTSRLSRRHLVAFLDRLASMEDEGMRRVDATYRAHRHRQDRRAADDGPVAGPPEDDAWRRLRPGEEGWRPEYYSLLFPVPVEVADVCSDYLAGLAWTVAYYFGAAAAWTSDYRYVHAFSPTCVDLARFAAGLADEDFLAIRADAIAPGPATRAAAQDPKLHLLFVLPPRYAALLPRPLRPVFHRLELGCVHMYPARFRATPYLKWHASEAVPRVPDLDCRAVMSAFATLKRRTPASAWSSRSAYSPPSQ